MLMARDDAERAAYHFDVAFRTARSLPVRDMISHFTPFFFLMFAATGVLSRGVLASNTYGQMIVWSKPTGVGGRSDCKGASCSTATRGYYTRAPDQPGG